MSDNLKLLHIPCACRCSIWPIITSVRF